MTTTTTAPGMVGGGRRKKRVLVRRKRTIDQRIKIDYKNPDLLKRFITDRGKIIPRRISGATARQQREICLAIKRARYIGLLPYAVNHRSEKGFAGEMSMYTAVSQSSFRRPPFRSDRGGYDRGGGGGYDRDGGGQDQRSSGSSDSET